MSSSAGGGLGGRVKGAGSGPFSAGDVPHRRVPEAFVSRQVFGAKSLRRGPCGAAWRPSLLEVRKRGASGGLAAPSALRWVGEAEGRGRQAPSVSFQVKESPQRRDTALV